MNRLNDRSFRVVEIYSEFRPCIAESSFGHMIMDLMVAGQKFTVESCWISNGKKAQPKLGHQSAENFRDPSTAVDVDYHRVKSQIGGPYLRP